MRPVLEHRRRPSRYLGSVLIALVLVVAAGFCVVDRHASAGHDHAGMPVDLCVSMLGAVTDVAPLIALAAIGWVPLAPRPTFVVAWRRVLTPPPRLSFR